MDTSIDETTRVLLVEENPDDALLVQEVLDHSFTRFPVTWVSTLTDAVNFLAQNEVDVVLLDLMLPESQGTDTIDTLRQTAPAVPIVVLTDAEGGELDAAGRRHGVRSLLAKAHLQAKDYLAGALRYAISRRQADRALVAAEQRLNFALQTSGAGSWSYQDRDKSWVFAGPVQFRGEPGRSAMAHPKLIQELDESTVLDLERQLAAALQGKSEVKLDYVIADSENQPRTIRLHGRAGQQAGEILGICWDVSESVRLTERLSNTQKLESLELLAGGVAHDFNNLLTTILGNTGLCIGEASANGPLTNWLKEIEMAALNAADLTRQLLAYSGKGRFVVRDLDLVALVQDTAALLRSAVGAHTSLRLNLPAKPLWVKGDETQLRQILVNLVRNGSEALRGTDGTVTVSMSNQNSNGASAPFVVMEVSDNGEGMTENDQRKIFDPFFTTKLEGRGLGLAAVKGIVKAHGGEVQVQSTIGEGTSFRVMLPAVPGPEGTSPDSKGRVLVADDDPSIRKMIGHLLRHLELEAIHAADGQQAIELFRQHAEDISLVLMDLSMPIMSGADASAQIRQASSHTPIIIMSGYSQDDLPATEIHQQMAFIHKPFSASELKSHINAALS